MAIYGRLAGLAGSGKPKSWVPAAAAFETAVFTAPANGWYRIHLIGGGGNGGKGGTGDYSHYNSSYVSAYGGGGGGGGGGGYSIHKMYLEKGRQITVTITDGKAVLSQGGTAIATANKGGNGSSGGNGLVPLISGSLQQNHGANGNGGAGGTASGGNELNLQGKAGAKSGTTNQGGEGSAGIENAACTYSSIYGAAQGGAANTGSRKVGNAGENGESVLLSGRCYTGNGGGGGSGGNGASSASSGQYAGGSGGEGSPGGFVIERYM